MPSRPIASFVLLSCFTALAACASAGGSAKDLAESPDGRRADCALRSQDSVFLARGVVYRDCAVDVRARLVTPVRADFSPPRPACYSVTMEFVVDTAGVVDTRSARVTRTTDNAFAESVSLTLPRLRFHPALRDGIKVNQIVSHGAMMSSIVVRVPAGSPPPSKGMMPPAPKC